MKQFRGLIAAAYSPFHPDNSLNLDVIDQLTQLYLESGIAAVFLCGTTGESHSLTVVERQRIAERWMEATDDRLPVLVHVGHNCQQEAIALAAHAEEVGVAAIAALAPSYFRPESVEDLVEFLAPIAAAAPHVPFYYYDVPTMTGVRLAADRLLQLGQQRIPTLKGVKFTSDDFLALQACLGLDDGAFDILFGNDESLLAGLAFGARGAIGSTYNYAAPVYRRVIDAFSRGDLSMARAEQRKSVMLVKAISEFGVLRAGKAIMSLLGINCGPVRPPVRPMSSAEVRALHERIRHLEVFSRPLHLPEEPAP